MGLIMVSYICFYAIKPKHTVDIIKLKYIVSLLNFFRFNGMPIFPIFCRQSLTFASRVADNMKLGKCIHSYMVHSIA